MTKKLPYLTDEQLKKPVEAVTIQVWGECRKRAGHRKEVITESYDIPVVVPKNFDTGHVRLCVNRELKRNHGAINARTHYVDTKVKPVKAEGEYIAKDFISDAGIIENERQRKKYHDDLEAAKRSRESGEDGPLIGGVYDESSYGSDGLLPLSKKNYAV
jgi:hypothetical protein